MKLYSKKIVIASLVMGILPLLFMFPCFGGAILDGYPERDGADKQYCDAHQS